MLKGIVEQQIISYLTRNCDAVRVLISAASQAAFDALSQTVLSWNAKFTFYDAWFVGVGQHFTLLDTQVAAIPTLSLVSGLATSGTAPFVYTFTRPYKTPPLVVAGVCTMLGDQLVIPGVTAITTTTCTVNLQRSKSLLTTTSGLLERCPNGTAFTLLVSGVPA